MQTQMPTQKPIFMPMIQPLKLGLKKILIEKHENTMTKAEEWLNESKLTLNLDKNKTGTLTKPKTKLKNNFSIKMNNKDIEQKSVFKHLGLYLNKKLEIEDHIEGVSNKLNKIFGIIYQLRRIINKQQLNLVQHGLLIYGSTPN